MFIVLYTPMLILLTGSLFVSYKTSIPVKNFTRDLAAITNSHPFMGVLSNIGVLFWCATVAICFFSFAVLKKQSKLGEFADFFISAGLVTLMLLLDDLFLAHEKIFPEYFQISENVVFLSYGIIVLLFLAKFKNNIIATEFILLFSAFGFFAASIIIDLVPLPISQDLLFLLEDGFKLFGIVGWFGYFARACFQVMKYLTENNEVGVYMKSG